jgi:cytochrome b pre-mRNA-processing protein 3
MTGDKDMASMIWRNFLGARGAQGIAYPDPDVLYGKVPSPDTSAKTLDPTTAGIVDFEGTCLRRHTSVTVGNLLHLWTPGSAVDQYIRYPELMLLLTCYIRRELTRLGNITDTAILGGEGSGMVELVMGPQNDEVDKNDALKPLEESMAFGTVREAGRKMGIDIKSFRPPQISTLG